MADVTTLGQAGVIARGQADVARLRERNRQRRMQRSLAFFGPLAVYLWWRQLTGDPVVLGRPHFPAGTGKTYMAKALAKEAGVPFFYVSSSAFQSMYYGQTNRKIRSYFKELRKAARAEGGAVGFIEEIDAIAASRAGMRMTGAEGV